MADFIIRPQGGASWSGAAFLSGGLPLTAVDAVAAGLSLDTDYEIARIGEVASFHVTDTVAPVLSSLIVIATSATELQWSVTSDTAGGTIYVVAESDLLRNFTASEIVSGTTADQADTDATPTADGANGGTLTGLPPNTAHNIFAVHVGPSGGVSNILQVAATTDQPGDVTPPAYSSLAVGAITGTNLPVTITALTEDAPNCYLVGTASAQTTLTAAQVVAGTDEADAAAPVAEGPFAITQAAATVDVEITASIEASLHWYLVIGDAVPNYSSVISLGQPAVDTIPDPAGITPSRILATPYTDSSESTDTHVTAAVTPSGNHPVAIVCHTVRGATDTWEGFDAATFGLVDLTATTPYYCRQGRCVTAVFIVENPANSAQAVSITPDAGVTTRGMVIEVLQLTGAATTATVGASDVTHLDSAQSGLVAIDITTVNADSLVLYASSRQFDSAAFAHDEVDASLSQTTSGGGSSSRDPDGRISWEAAATAGLYSADVSAPSGTPPLTNVILEIKAA